MSWSREVKDELCEVKLRCASCSKALLYGLLLNSRGVTETELSIVTESGAAARLLAQSLAEELGVIVNLNEPSLRDRTTRPAYTVSLPDGEDAVLVWKKFFVRQGKSGIRAELFPRECCGLAFLRGAWLACGTMSNPEKEYHLEFSPPDGRTAEELSELLEDFGLEFHTALRGKNTVIYIKEGELLEDTLARLGAVRASLSLMNLKLEKELRNQVNRVTNCETANISKTVNASLSQIEKITRLREKTGFVALAPPLREAAELRLANPDASLRELCELAGGKLSRSGLNHRLQKLCELAARLDDSK